MFFIYTLSKKFAPSFRLLPNQLYTVYIGHWHYLLAQSADFKFPQLWRPSNAVWRNPLFAYLLFFYLAFFSLHFILHQFLFTLFTWLKGKFLMDIHTYVGMYIWFYCLPLINDFHFVSFIDICIRAVLCRFFGVIYFFFLLPLTGRLLRLVVATSALSAVGIYITCCLNEWYMRFFFPCEG